MSSLDDHFAKKASSASRSSSPKKDWDDASGDLSLNSDIRAMSREAHELLNQILNDTSESATTKTPAKEPSRSGRRGGKSGGHDTSYDDEEMEDELGRVDDVSDDIRALSAELNAVRTNERGEVVAPVPVEPNDNNQLELMAQVTLFCTPGVHRSASNADDSTQMIRFDPAVEQLKALQVAISNKDIAPAPSRSRAMKKEAPGRLEDGVDQVILIACIFIWTVIVIIVDHTRTYGLSFV